MATLAISQVHGKPAILGGDPLFAQRFRFIKPTLPALEEVVKLYESQYNQGVITNADLVSRFETAIAERLGVRHCVAVSSCTSGLTLVLKALGLTGEVIIPSFTFFATGHAVRWNALRPVLADCCTETWNIDPEDVERRITEKTSAILAVHLYGNPCAVEKLEAIASRYGLKLIFDAAHGFGSQRKGVPIGGFGDAEVFSLSPTKLLVSGEGGLVTTNDETLARIVRAQRNYGDTGSYDPEHLGLNARMTEFNAALGLTSLALTGRKVARHNEIADLYTMRLAHLPGLKFQTIAADDVCTYKDYSIHISAKAAGIDRDGLAASLLAENIETKRYFYPPMHEQRLYRQFAPSDRPLSCTDYIANGILSLPIYESLPDSTVEGVAVAIERIISHAQDEKSWQGKEVLECRN